MRASAIPLALYIHVPWCLKKCPYCDFNSHTMRAGVLPEKRYVDALIQDFAVELSRDQRMIQSIFIGGGTPSLLSPESIARLLSHIRASGRLLAGAEITLEANPATPDEGRWAGFKQAGVNRLSVGVQSFNDTLLQALGRVHDGAQALATLAQIHRVGFQQVNIDLMFGLPGQTLAMAKADVQQALQLCPQHLSYYQLTIEPNTLFYHQTPVLPEEDRIWEMQQVGQALMREQGYTQYEVSAYALPDCLCQHNVNYWQFGDYLAIGAGAHGKHSSDSGVVRYAKPRQPEQYMQRVEDGQVDNVGVPVASLMPEVMMNVLRLKAGIKLCDIAARTGLSVSALASACEEAVTRGLLTVDGGKLRPTTLGWTHLNTLMLLFFD